MADFKPTLAPIHEKSPFKFWCQKVLPSVYDDSLSYYELLTKVVYYLNENTQDLETINSNVEALYNSYVELQNYANTYFEQDFPLLVEEKLDEMAENGTLTALIKNYIDPYFEEQTTFVNSSISEQNSLISSTLSAQNNNISSNLTAQNNAIQVISTRVSNFIESQSSNPDAELVDIRVGYNAEEYLTAGDAVRGQIFDVHNAFSQYSTTTIADDDIIIPDIIHGAWTIIGGDDWNQRARTRTLIHFVGTLDLSLPDYTKYKYSYVYYESPDFTGRHDSGWLTEDSSDVYICGYGVGFNFAYIDDTDPVISSSDLIEIKDIFTVKGTGNIYDLADNVSMLTEYIAKKINDFDIPYGKIINGVWDNDGYVSAGNRATFNETIKFRGLLSISLSSYNDYQYSYVIYSEQTYANKYSSGWLTEDTDIVLQDGYAFAINFAHVGGSGAITSSDIVNIIGLLSLTGAGYLYTDVKDMGDTVYDNQANINEIKQYVSREINTNTIPHTKLTKGTWTENGYNYSGNRGTVSELIFFNGSFSISLSDYTDYQYSIVLYPTNDLTNRIDSGWLTADSDNVQFNGYAIALNFAHLGGSGAITEADLIAIEELLTITGSGAIYVDTGELEDKINDIKNNPLTQIGSNICRTKLCYDHLFVNKTGDDVVIPSESIYHVQLSKRFGFDMIEGNVQKTSDNVYFVHHLSNGKFGNYFHHVDGETDISNVSASSVTWEYIVENVRYNSTIPVYRTRPCTLEEFLNQCKISEVIPFVSATESNSIEIVKNIMGNGNYILYGTDRRLDKNAIIYHWCNLTTKADILAYCNSIGKPFIYGMSNVTYFSTSELKEIVSELHNNGYMIGCSYADNNWYKLAPIGFDFNGTNKHINRIIHGNICNLDSTFNYNDFTYTNASLSNGELTYNSFGYITPNIANTVYDYCGIDVEIWFDGKINIPVYGEQDSTYDITSDGESSVFITTPIVHGSVRQSFGVYSGTKIKHICYKASKF